MLHLHIVSNYIKTKETNYYSQCLFFHEIQFVSQFPSYNNERCACLSFCLTSNGFIIGSIFSVFTKVRHCQKLISKFRVSNTWTNTRFFSICWVSEWESVFRSVKFSYFLVSQTRQIYFKGPSVNEVSRLDARCTFLNVRCNNLWMNLKLETWNDDAPNHQEPNECISESNQ